MTGEPSWAKTKRVKPAYTIKEAQRHFAAIVRRAEDGGLPAITRRAQPVAYVIGAERLAALADLPD